MRSLDVEPYRTPRSGEGIRTSVFGMEVEVEPRDRRAVSAWDLGVASTVRTEPAVQPFGSLYFWRHPDDDSLLRAIVVGVYNEVLYTTSNADLRPFEVALTFNSFTVPIEQGELVDGKSVDDEKLEWGWVRPGVGFGYRTQIAPGEQDNMFSTDLLLEPGLLYFGRGSSTSPDYRVPDTTFELRAVLQTRLDALQRNLLELPHAGIALGADLVYGYRSDWSDWGVPATSSFESADAGRDYLLFTAYAFGVGPVPFVDSDRHRLLASVHGGLGDGVDRFSASRVGGGPDALGEEYGATARPILPGAAIQEFYPEHYVLGYLAYRWEPVFFGYLEAGTAAAWLDRRRASASGTTVEDGWLHAVNARWTSGFFGDTRLQIGYAYDFDVVRDGSRGGYEIVVHVSGEF